MSSILVTSYDGPDLDGTAGSIGYAEFLQKQGTDAVAVVFDKPHREAEFVLKTFHIPNPLQGQSVYSSDSKIILVDASEFEGLAPEINPKQIIAIIDHRKVNDAHKFPNAKIQIELVGSACTLIAEKFYQNQIEISESSAALLYSAIVSNTINFQANVTTDRDGKMADWLLTKFTRPESYIHEMFADKSKFAFEKPVQEIFSSDFATFTFSNKHIGIEQLEIIHVEKFIKERFEEIQRVLKSLQKEKQLDYIFLTAIDLEKATNTFAVIDEDTEKLLEKSLAISFENNVAKRNGIMMRKTITPLLKQWLENNVFS